MKKLKIASFVTLLISLIIIPVYSWTASMLNLAPVMPPEIVCCIPLFALISFFMNIVIIKKDRLGFVSFNLLIASLAVFMIQTYILIWFFTR